MVQVLKCLYETHPSIRPGAHFSCLYFPCLHLPYPSRTQNIHHTMTDPSIKGLRYMPYPSGLATIGTQPAQSSQDAGLSFSPSSAPLPSNDAASVSSNQLVLYRRSVRRPRNDESGACTPSAHRDKVRVVAGPAQRQFDEVISLHSLFEHH